MHDDSLSLRSRSLINLTSDNVLCLAGQMLINDKWAELCSGIYYSDCMDEFKDTQRCYVLEQEEGILQE